MNIGKKIAAQGGLMNEQTYRAIRDSNMKTI